jgi:hypothetical protein
MKYINTFMRSYRIIMEEKSRQTEFMRKLEIEKMLKEYNERLNRIQKKIKKN